MIKPPVIILGAGRSGTKLIRGILGAHPELVYIPREINYIWRYGNSLYPTDELKPEHARPGVIRYIHRRLDKFSAANDGKRVIEKTCANSLRVDFVREVYGHALIIHMVRDGRSVAESAFRCWHKPPDVDYLLEKLMWVPLKDIPYYALRYFKFQLGRISSDSGAQSSWGPRFHGLDKAVRELSMIEVAALQWSKCVGSAREALNRMDDDYQLTVRYEDLISDPEGTATLIYDRLGISMVPEVSDHIRDTVRSGYADKWKERLSNDQVARLLPFIEDELKLNGYGA